jgi:hypothetical protein
VGTGDGRTVRRAALRRTNQLALLRDSGSSSVTVLCECGEGCGKWLNLEADEYASGSSRKRHVLAPGHQAESDRIVRERRSYIVVEA